MKLKIILLLFICSTICSISFCKANNKVDSLFTYHFKILDSIANNKFIDSTLRCIESIQFMELNTSINSSTDGNYFGKTSFTKEDLKNWHNWYISNRNNLFWDEKEKMVKKK